MNNVADNDQATDWSRDTQKLAVLTWITFLTASAFTMLFFAFVDPLVIVDSINVAWIESSNAGYAIGFFFFWVNGWIAGWLTLRLVRRKRTGPISLPRRD